MRKLDELHKLNDSQKSADQLHDKFDTLKAKQDELTEKFNVLEKRVDDLEKTKTSGSSKSATDKVSKAADLLITSKFEQRALQIESQALADELSISGLKEKVGDDLNTVVGNLFNELGTPMDKSKIKFVRRIGKQIEARTRFGKQKQRDVLIKFDTKETVDSIITKAKNIVIPGNRLIKGDDVPSDPAIEIIPVVWFGHSEEKYTITCNYFIIIHFLFVR